MRIILVRPDGIGDEILSLPVASELRRSISGAEITFLSRPAAAPLLENHPDIDSVLTITGQESRQDLVGLFKSGFDTAIFLKPFRNLITAAFLAGVPQRVGTGFRWFSILLNRRVYEHRSDFSKHESEYNVGLLRGLGIVHGEIVPPRITLTPDELDFAASLPGEKRAGRILIHPGGFSSRRWKSDRFRGLALDLAEKGYRVILSGSAEERDRFYAEAGAGEWPEGVSDLMGTLSVRQLAAVIGNCNLVISMSTGPMHMASALVVSTLSIFDPRRSSLPVRWKPLGKGIILKPRVPVCEKCSTVSCKYWDCLDLIGVRTVSDYAMRAISDPQPVSVIEI